MLEFYCNCCGCEFVEGECILDVDNGYVVCPNCGAEHYEDEDDYITAYGF